MRKLLKNKVKEQILKSHHGRKKVKVKVKSCLDCLQPYGL